jgi:addiction module RelE/StbE family toxin
MPAAQDLEEITLFIQKDSPSAARAVAKTLFDTANSLDKLPSRGRAGRIMGTRELVVQGLPYIIVYGVMDTAVQILHIYHAARNDPEE